jgi:SNF2 family DNA or RNA helicase
LAGSVLKSNAEQVNLLQKFKDIRVAKEITLAPCKLLRSDFVPRNYQKQAALLMIGMTQFILGDDTGIGKTKSTITAYAYLKERDPELRMMVLCPKSALYQWREEILGTLSVPLKIQIIRASGSDAMRKDVRGHIYDGVWDILIMTYATFRNDADLLTQTLKAFPVVLVLDEIQAARAVSSKISKTLRKIAPLARRVYGLTATIIQNRLEDAYSIFTIVVPKLFPNLKWFQDSYMKIIHIRLNRPPWKFPKVLGFKNLNHFRATIDPFFIGRTKSEIGEQLPDLVTQDVLLDMNPEQHRLYREAETGILTLPNDKLYEMKYIFQKLVICQVLADSPKIKDYDASSSKEEELVRMLDEEMWNTKTIIFSIYRAMVDRLEILLKDYRPLRITGAEDAQERDAARLAFLNDPTRKIILINTAGAESLNLQSARNLIFYDLPWNYGRYYQIVGRAHRLFAAEKTIYIYHLLSKDSIDEDVLRTLKSKRDLVLKAIPKGPDNLLEYQSDTGFLKDMIANLKQRNVKLKGVVNDAHVNGSPIGARF